MQTRLARQLHPIWCTTAAGSASPWGRLMGYGSPPRARQGNPLRDDQLLSSGESHDLGYSAVRRRVGLVRVCGSETVTGATSAAHVTVLHGEDDTYTGECVKAQEQ
jgi:hypothetical protein